MKKRPLITNAAFITYNLLIGICILLVVTCNTSCFVHRHKQAQATTTDTAATHTESSTALTRHDSAATTEQRTETENSFEIEFDSTGGTLPAPGSVTADDYFYHISGKVKKITLKGKASTLHRDSAGITALDSSFRWKADSTHRKVHIDLRSTAVTRFNVTAAGIVLLLLLLLYLAYRYRHHITSWIIGNDMLP